MDPVDPNTQRIIPTPGITEKIEIWFPLYLRVMELMHLDFVKKRIKKLMS